MKTVIVTGASRGIGEAIVRNLRALGCRVIGIARSTGPLENLKAEKIGSAEFDFVSGDVCEPEILEKAVKLATRDGGSLDGLILNAGTADPIEKCSELSMEQLKNTFNVNFFSAVNLCKIAIPHLRASHGRIIFTSTGVAESPMSAWAPYCSSKAAMNMYLKCLAREEPEIVCMSIRPGIVNTAIVQSLYSDPHRAEVMDPDQYKFMLMQRDQGKLLEPERPAEIFSKLILKAPKSLSGQFFSWDDLIIRRNKRNHRMLCQPGIMSESTTENVFVEYKIPAKELRKLAETSVYSNLDFDRPNPDGEVLMCPLLTHSAPQLQIEPQTNVISMPCCKGYCSSKASHGVKSGNWYFEVEIVKGAVRVGWGQALAEIQAPVGYDEYGYAISNKQGKIFHCSRGYPVGFDQNVKVIGCLLRIPYSLELVDNDNDKDEEVRRNIELKYPPLNFLTTYNVKQTILKQGSIQFFADGQEIPGAHFHNIYRAKYFPSVSIFGDAVVKVLLKESDFKFPIPEGVKAFEQSRYLNEMLIE